MAETSPLGVLVFAADLTPRPPLLRGEGEPEQVWRSGALLPSLLGEGLGERADPRHRLLPGVTASFGPSLGRESARERDDRKPYISRRETQAHEQRIATVSSGV